MNCYKCNKYYEDSLILKMAIAANIFILLFVVNILATGYHQFFLVVIYIFNSFMNYQYLPVISAGPTEYLMLPPTYVEFEKTNDVSENIKRYKEAQRLAIKNKLTNQSGR